MDDPSYLHYFLLFFLLICSSFFSGAEVALVSLSAAKVKTLAQDKRPGASFVAFLKDRPERLLIIILVGNNVVNILIPVLSTVIFTALFGSHILGIMTGILTILILLFGEILPKTLAQRYAEGFSLFAAPVIFILGKLLFPVVRPLEKLLKVMGAKGLGAGMFSDQELMALAEIGEEEGQLESEKRRRIESVLEFSETTASEVMTPRPDIATFADTLTIEEAVNYFTESTYSRIPVYHETKDKICGILTFRNAVLLKQKYPPDTLLSDITVQYPLYVPLSMHLEDIFKKMKRQKTHMAIVIDEHGGTAGLVTMEDLLEEIFGEIQDETDRELMEFRRISDTECVVLGSTDFDEIHRELGWDLPDHLDDSVARVILDLLGRFPEQGEKVEIDSNLSAVIEKMDDFKIEWVRLIFNSEKEEKGD
ncbi:MAG: hemolysin family protein [Desulfurivibrionaceae bacterium]